MKENDGGVNLTKISCKHFCKCQKVPTPSTTIYANKKRILNFQHENKIYSYLLLYTILSLVKTKTQYISCNSHHSLR
jgi:hypothetical protein